MGIQVVRGDILKRKETYIVIPVNCVGAVGRGLALTWGEQFPDLVAEYREGCRLDYLRPGEFAILEAKNGQKYLLAATKNHFKDPAQIEWVSTILMQIARLLMYKPKATLVLPPIAGGLGWISKSKIIKMIHKKLDHLGERVVLIDNE